MSTDATSVSPQAGRQISFSINGVKQVVKDVFSPSTSLNDYIRDVAGLKGTKVMCREAGCGCCAVTVTRTTNDSNTETMSINSCVCPLYSVDGWEITTVEGIGSHKKGLHPIQERLARYNGSQCGYCSPGFVMSMYGLLHQQPKATEQEIEDSLDGHICRCTGYRPILDAMRTFGSDSTAAEKPLDIEDLNKYLCPKTGQPCHGKSDDVTPPRALDIDAENAKWYRPTNLAELSKFRGQEKSQSIRLVYGNTSTGIYKDQGPFDVYFDLRAVDEIHQYKETDNAITFGAGTTFTKLKEYLKGLKKKSGFHYCEGIIKHLKVLANVLVRNAGCIAGNLMIKHAHNESPSDFFTIMEAVGATVEYYDIKTLTMTSKVSLQNFLKLDMTDKLLVAINIPKWNDTDHYRSFKITPRWQNAHAYVNAAFKIPNQNRKILSRPSIVVGGISATTIHAEKAEAYLDGKDLDDAVIQEALRLMYNELQPTTKPLAASPKYRKELATNLLYKTLLEVYKPTQADLQSGADSFIRPLSSGMFTFQEKPQDFPIKEPLPKKLSAHQTAGEAEYVNDIPNFQRELAASFVTSTIAKGSIKDIDATDALKMPGVVRFICAKDLPPDFVNNYIGANPFGMQKEELFVSKDVYFEGQGIGVILAESRALAAEAAKKVKVTYENETKPILTLEDAIANDSRHGAATQSGKGDIADGWKKSTHIVQGEVSEGTQYQFYMEHMVALTVPKEDGIDVYAAHQYPDFAHRSICQVINKPFNYCDIITPRLGGAYGGKFIHASAVCAASAVCTELTGRPIRLTLDLSTCMKMTEKRYPMIAKYKCGCDDNGILQAMTIDLYCDSGFNQCPFMTETLHHLFQAYNVPNLVINYNSMKTDKVMSGTCRAPGHVPGMLITETIMEHMAKGFGQHPILFKELNLIQENPDPANKNLAYCPLSCMWTKIKQSAEVVKRMEEIKKFNKVNKWRKRGINMTPVKYAIGYLSRGFPTSVSIFAGDGTVTVSTSGVEMGQGLHMKVAQAVAKTLGVPLDHVKVRPHNNSFLPNATTTAASSSSERCVLSAIAACEQINARLKPLKEKMKGMPFKSIVSSSREPLYAATEDNSRKDGYSTFLVGVNEIEVDVLTGEFQVKRVDILADFGESLNPTVDLGQLQGGYVMSLGGYMTEDMFYDPDHGTLLNDGTWEYKPPTTKDIPIDWRIHFLTDNPNSKGVLGSKATGEPPMGLAASAMLSIKSAMEDVRRELTKEDVFANTSVPFTVEKIQQAANIGLSHLHVADSS